HVTQDSGGAHRARVPSHGDDRLGPLSVWVFSLPGPRDRALPSDRIRIAAGGADPISRRTVIRQHPATIRCNLQTPCSGSAARPLTFPSVSPNRYRIAT